MIKEVWPAFLARWRGPEMSGEEEGMVMSLMAGMVLL
jgi:hypothetical protein